MQVLVPLATPVMLTPAQAQDLDVCSFTSLMGMFMQGGSLRKPGGPLAWGKTQSCLLSEIDDLTVQLATMTKHAGTHSRTLTATYRSRACCVTPEHLNKVKVCPATPQSHSLLHGLLLTEHRDSGCRRSCLLK